MGGHGKGGGLLCERDPLYSKQTQIRVDVSAPSSVAATVGGYQLAGGGGGGWMLGGFSPAPPSRSLGIKKEGRQFCPGLRPGGGEVGS